MTEANMLLIRHGVEATFMILIACLGVLGAFYVAVRIIHSIKNIAKDL
jgi:hypothetical protein